MREKTIDAPQAYRKTHEGRAILVCAYDDEDRCREILLDGAITYGEFLARVDRIPKTTEIIFYCDRPEDELASRRVDELRSRGFENARVLEGGVKEWRHAGHPMAAETAPENPPLPV